MARLIGISGKPGSNKLAYVFRIVRELRVRGLNAQQVFLAQPLYEELNEIAKELLAGVAENELKLKYELGDKSDLLFELLKGDIGDFHPEYGLSRRKENVRKSLALLGSGIRREQNEDYFLERLTPQLEGLDFAVFADMRYPNEAEHVERTGGMTIRVNITHEDDHSGGYKYEAGMEDPSELALDDYPFFDYIFMREIFNGIEFGHKLEEFFGLPSFKETVR